jgi:hypothetical protein
MSDLDEDRLRKKEGVFSAEHDEGREAGCDPAEDRCAPDTEGSYGPPDRATPGTQDDIPYSFGEATPKSPGQGELWGEQQALIEEDEQNAYNLEGIPEEEIGEVLEAIGDDAAEANPELPGGTSATGAGSPLEPDHGGFPEREE